MFKQKCQKCGLILSIICGLLAGCATIYAPPKSGEPTAKIHAMSNRSGLYTWTNTEIEAIDNKSPGLTVFEGSNFNVYPGRHVITVKVSFNRGFLSMPSDGVTDVVVNFKAGHVYTIRGDVHGSVVSAWVVNESGQKVSATSSVHYQQSPVERAPIIIPVRQ